VTITVQIHISDGERQQTEHLTVTDDAQEAIRFSFNPSQRNRVTRLKALAAAFISEAEVAGEETGAGREAAVAITNMQTASMWAVLGATKSA
jgi:hypothetical protein